MPLTDENNADFANITESNLNRVHNTVSKVGYSDGITDGRESVFQKGFDIGYEGGLLTGFELAKIKAFFEAANKNPPSEQISAESARYDELSIPPPKDNSHFKIPELTGKTTDETFKQQLNYVQQHKAVFARELPTVTDLFSQ